MELKYYLFFSLSPSSREEGFYVYAQYYMEVKYFAKSKGFGTKKALVADLSKRLQNACTGVVVGYEGINVADDKSKLRREL